MSAYERLQKVKGGKLERSLFQLCIYNLEAPSIAKNLKNEKFLHFCNQFGGFYFLSKLFSETLPYLQQVANNQEIIFCCLLL